MIGSSPPLIDKCPSQHRACALSPRHSLLPSIEQNPVLQALLCAGAVVPRLSRCARTAEPRSRYVGRCGSGGDRAEKTRNGPKMYVGALLWGKNTASVCASAYLYAAQQRKAPFPSVPRNLAVPPGCTGRYGRRSHVHPRVSAAQGSRSAVRCPAAALGAAWCSTGVCLPCSTGRWKSCGQPQGVLWGAAGAPWQPWKLD